MTKFIKELDYLLEKNTEVVLATMVKHVASAPGVDGAKVIVSKNGLQFGTVGGGKIEERVIDEAKSLLLKKSTTLFITWNLQREIGMTCGGEVSFFFEKFGRSHFEVAIFGAGHVAQALIPLLLKLDIFVSCIDSRKTWLDRLPDTPKLEKVLLDEPATYVDSLSSDTFILSITQGHKFDLPILEKAFNNVSKFPYIGAIGSDKKAQVLKHDLLTLGVNAPDLERLLCPLGQKFGSNSPVEISFSIIAQLLSERDRLASLREQTQA